MKTFTAQISIIGVALVLLGAGCGSSGPQAPDGGLLRSADGGTAWQQKSNVFIAGGSASAATFAALDVNVFVADPTHPHSLWVGTMNNGILYSFDGGDGWLSARTITPTELSLTTSRVNGITVDPKNECAVYAVISPLSGPQTGKSFVIRTTNCGRAWNLVYTNELADSVFSAIAFNPFNDKELFVGDTNGNLIHYDIPADSWRKITRFENAGVRSIVPNPKKEGEYFVALKAGGLAHTIDNGTTWSNPNFKQFRGANDVYVIALDPSKADSLLVGSKYGILRSDDSGNTWTPLPLLTAPGETQILSLGINPTNPNHIFYGTPKAFYRSDDHGANWTNKRVPTARVIKNILVQQEKVAGIDTELLWIGAWSAPQ